jgi:hypothetical protein
MTLCYKTFWKSPLSSFNSLNVNKQCQFKSMYTRVFLLPLPLFPILCVCVFVCVCGAGDPTQGLTGAKHVLSLSYNPSLRVYSVKYQ